MKKVIIKATGHRDPDALILMFTPAGVCCNCVNGFHQGCNRDGCKCAERKHRQWWFRTDGIKDEAEALAEMEKLKNGQALVR